jgi:hypothetical protein
MFPFKALPCKYKNSSIEIFDRSTGIAPVSLLFASDLLMKNEERKYQMNNIRLTVASFYVELQ